MSVTAGERTAADRLGAQASRRSSTMPPASHRRAVAVLLAVALLALPAGLLQHPADRPRRGALRAGHQADGRERRLHRHPLPGRGALQEAGRHLLAAGRRREDRERARRSRRADHHLALSHSLADRRDRRGAADLLGGACVRLAARRRARRLDDGKLDPARRSSALLAKTDAMLLLTVVAAMGAMARAYLPEQRERLDTAGAGRSPAVFWTALAAGVLLKGPLILMVVALAVDHAGRRRSLGALARRAQAVRRRGLVRASGAAVVPRHHRPCRRRVLRRVGRAGSARPRS